MSTQFQHLDAARLPQKLHVQWSMTLEDDDSGDRPDTNDEGFWPSVDPNAAGYVGVRSTQSTKYKRALEAATERMRAFDLGHWHYVGVVAVVDLLIPIGGTSFRAMRLASAGLWGIESDSGDYLKHVYQEEKGELISQIKSFGVAIASEDFIQQDNGG